MYDYLCRWAAVDPDRTALIWEKDEPGQEERVSYSQLHQLVGKLANLLLQVRYSQLHQLVGKLANLLLQIRYSQLHQLVGKLANLLLQVRYSQL
jgi:acyl-coenzyme A synthetase/AMP-(fatty) acid ligase